MTRRNRRRTPSLARWLSRDRRASSGAWVGRDFASQRHPAAAGRRHLAIAGLIALAGAVVAGLSIASLRVAIIEQSYALGAAMKQERALFEELRTLTAQREVLRNHTRLAQLAPQLELDRPQRVIPLAARAPVSLEIQP